MTGSRSTSRSGGEGFTLIEVMATSAVSVLLIGTVLSVFVYQLKTSRSQEMISEMNQNVRTAVDMISMDTYMAGYGIPVPPSLLSSWISWVPAMTNNPHIVQGSGNLSDTLYIAAAFGPPEATLSHPAARGAITLRVDGSTPNVNVTDRKIIYIGRQEVARVVSIFGNELTISTDPSVGGRGLKRFYPVGTELELVRVMKYEAVLTPSGFPYRPHLRRLDSAETYAFAWQQTAATGIDDFQVTRNGEAIIVELTGKTEHPDSKYTDPMTGDHYRRVTLQRSITPRN